MKPEKREPLGICDCCKSEIPRDDWYTSHGAPRLYCCRDCRNRGNRHTGAEAHRQAMIANARRPDYVPVIMRQEPGARRKHAVHAARAGRLREVADGRWRNPALSDEAREKLSRPRVHTDDPLVHRALQLLRQGVSVADLPADVRDAHRVYRREIAARHREERNARARAEYRRRREQERGKS